MKKTGLKNLLRLYRFIFRHWWIAALGVGLTVVYSALNAARLWVVKPVTDQAVLQKDISALWMAARFLGILVPGIFLAHMGHVYFSRRLLWAVVVDLRNKICESLLPQSVSFFEDRRSGDLMSRITNDVALTQRALLFLVAEIALLPCQLVAYAVVACWTNWRLFLVCFIGLPITAIPMVILGRQVKKSSWKGLMRLADLTDAMQQMFLGIRIVKAFKMEDAELRQFEQTNQAYFSRMMKVVKAKALTDAFVEFAANVGLVIVLLLGGYLIIRGTMTPGGMITFVAAFGLMYHPLKKLAKQYNNIMECIPATDRIFSLIDSEPEIKDAPDAVEIHGLNDHIRFNNVSFAYDTEFVLSDINLEVKKGEMIAFVGRSGAGKSTLCDLLARFYDPTKGSIEIDGVDLCRIKRSSLLDHIALVGQQTFLFNKSIAENIRYGKRDATMDEIIRAARAANIHDFIESLPEGYDTQVGEMGVKLSGGQRQRLAIARAILKNAAILILDEATSSLDSESEKLVQGALENLMKGRTTFLIAHRLSTVQHADRIVVLKKGRIIQIGTHEQLMKEGGEYRRLYELQFADVVSA